MEHTHHTEPKHEQEQDTSGSPASSPSWLLPASIMAAAVLISGSLIYVVHSKPAGPADPYAQPEVSYETPSFDDSANGPNRDVILGDPNAPVSMILYEDFQCPFCAQFFTEASAAIRTAYVETGKVKVVYRHFPLDFHPAALPAAEASECAKDQGKFWEYHDELYRSESAAVNETTLTSTLYNQIAERLGLNMEEFRSCVASGKHREFVQAQMQEGASKYGVNSTPTIFINGQKIEGALPFSEFQTIIDAEL